jgi:DNA-binding NtrC family response regulator
MWQRSILIVEGDEGLRRTLRLALQAPGRKLVEVFGLSSLVQVLRRQAVDLLLVGPWPDPAAESLAAVRAIRQAGIRLPIIVLTSQSSEETVIAALRAGVRDYFKPPFSFAEIGASVESLLEASQTPERGRRPARPSTTGAPPLIVGDSPAIRALRDYLPRVAAAESNVLITGETGTGKELVACYIHQHSGRHSRPLVSVNCAAIPDTLLESELFGHERGAFTGAHARREGHLSAAHGGTLFLDEVGEMSPAAQAKILRAIDSKEVSRLGGQAPVTVDVRFIAATNQDLEGRVAEARFRPDLYYRLNVARVDLPPLRERREDIPLLCHHYIGVLNRQLDREVQGLTEEAEASLVGYPWPGNVRELKNLLEATFIGVSSGHIGLAALPPQFRARLEALGGVPAGERERLLRALLATNWNKSKAAARLQWSRMTLYRRLAKYRLGGEARPSADESPGVSPGGPTEPQRP